LGEVRGLSLTAFDLFGILLPGALLVLALRVLLVPAFGPITVDLGSISVAAWIGMGFVCYLFGHLAQVCGRFVDRVASFFFPWGDLFRLSIGRPGQQEASTALEVIRQSLERRTGLDLGQLSDVVLSNVTDEFIEQYGDSATLASFRSREVYYRGVLAAMLALAVAFAVCALGGTSVVADPAIDHMRLAYGGLSGLSIVMSFAAGDAYRRQRRRRMRHSLIGYLVLESGGRLKFDHTQ